MCAIKKTLLFILEEIPIKISKKITGSLAIENELVILNIFYAIQFFMWICFYGLIAWKFNLFYNFILFLFLFTEVRRRFQEVEEKTIVNIKVLHSTIIGCFFLTFGYILLYLIFCLYFKSLILKIIVSIFIAINTIEFNKKKTEVVENVLLGRRSIHYDLEQRVKKYFLTQKENEYFTRVLNNIFEANEHFKTLCHLLYTKNKSMLEISFVMDKSYDTICRYKRDFYTLLKALIK